MRLSFLTCQSAQWGWEEGSLDWKSIHGVEFGYVLEEVDRWCLRGKNCFWSLISSELLRETFLLARSGLYPSLPTPLGVCLDAVTLKDEQKEGSEERRCCVSASVVSKSEHRRSIGGKKGRKNLNFCFFIFAIHPFQIAIL